MSRQMDPRRNVPNRSQSMSQADANRFYLPPPPHLRHLVIFWFYKQAMIAIANLMQCNVVTNLFYFNVFSVMLWCIHANLAIQVTALSGL